MDTNAFSIGLTSEEARRRLRQFGPNAMLDAVEAPWRRALGKFWAPVPWMLEAAILLQLVLGEYVEAAVIAALLIFNAALGYFQESRAEATLAALKSTLALVASVRRDCVWKTAPRASRPPGSARTRRFCAAMPSARKWYRHRHTPTLPTSPPPPPVSHRALTPGEGSAVPAGGRESAEGAAAEGD